MPARQFLYLPAASNALPIELGDDAVGHRISGGVPAQRRTVESRTIANSDYQQNINHGNKLNTHWWVVDRDHGTIAAAVAFMRDHADTVPVDSGISGAKLQETGDDGSIRFLQNCAIEAIECLRWDGQSTVYKYTVRGGAWTDTINGV